MLCYFLLLLVNLLRILLKEFKEVMNMNNIIEYFGTTGIMIIMIGLFVWCGLTLFEFFFDKKYRIEKRFDKKV